MDVADNLIQECERISTKISYEDDGSELHPCAKYIANGILSIRTHTWRIIYTDKCYVGKKFDHWISTFARYKDNTGDWQYTGEISKEEYEILLQELREIQ